MPVVMQDRPKLWTVVLLPTLPFWLATLITFGFATLGCPPFHRFSRLRRNRRLCNRHKKGAGYRTSVSLKDVQYSEMCLPVA